MPRQESLHRRLARHFSGAQRVGVYHKPSDDLSQPIRYDMGAKFARLNYLVTQELANGARPAWNKGDFFAGKFAKPP